VEKGRLSRSMITYDKIMYNQTNWRDDAVGKDKNVARGDFNPQPDSDCSWIDNSLSFVVSIFSLHRFNRRFNKSDFLIGQSIFFIKFHICS